MRGRSIDPSGHYLSGLAGFIGLAVLFGALPQAQAQTAATLNLQNQLNILLPSIAAPSPSSPEAPTSTGIKSLAETSEHPQAAGCQADSRALSALVRKIVREDRSFIARFSDRDLADALKGDRVDEVYLQSHPKHKEMILRTLPHKLKTTAYTVYQPCQPPSLKISVPFNPTYETDVLKTGNNSSPGTSTGIGGTALYTTPGVRPVDVIAASAGTASSRYADYPTKNLDAVSAQAFYQIFLSGIGYRPDATAYDIDISNLKSFPTSPTLLTFSYLALGVQNQTAFTPTFHSETSDLFTPQATYGWTNIKLDSEEPKCGALKPGICNYLDLALTAGQTFADVTTLENFNLAASATFGHRIDQSEWTIAFQAMATGRTYEDFPGGRDDVLLQAGPVLSFSHSFPGPPMLGGSAIAFSLPVTYYQNYSTVGKAAWGGLIVQPTLTLAFLPPVK